MTRRRAPRRGASRIKLLWAILALMGWLSYDLVTSGGISVVSAIGLVLLGIIILLYMSATDTAPPPAESTPQPDLAPDTGPPIVDDIITTVMEPEEVRREETAILIQGRLRVPSRKAFETLCAHYEPLSIQPLLRPAANGRTVLILVRRDALARPQRTNWPLHIILLLATLATTTWAGASMVGVDLTKESHRFTAGLPFSLGLLAILLLHELGHYFAARLYRMNVSPPFFIPVPFGLGTFGAFIQLRSGTHTRRGLFDVAVAGPLAGLAVALPVLVAGFRRSTIIPIVPAGWREQLESSLPVSSMLVHLVGRYAVGPVIDGPGAVVMGPLAFAGYLGILVTALNLLPIGQLDGGHMARAMFGQRAGTIISIMALAALFAAALTIAPNLMVWAVIVFMLSAARPVPPFDEVTRLTPGRMIVGLLSFALLVLILWPAPN